MTSELKKTPGHAAEGLLLELMLALGAAATGAGEVARGLSGDIALLVAAASVTGEGARRTVFALLPAATPVAGRRADHLNRSSGV
jgi:hypothetical protein